MNETFFNPEPSRQFGEFNYVQRELSILRYLQELDDPQAGATAREVWEAVRRKSGGRDDVTVQAYHKVLDQLVRVGKVEMADGDGAGSKRYRFAPSIHAANPLTLDDVSAYAAPSDFVARATEANDYLNERRETVLREAAHALREEEPVGLFCDFLVDRLDCLKKLIDECWDQQDGSGRLELQDDELVRRIQREIRDCGLLIQRLSVPEKAASLPDVGKVVPGATLRVKLDRDEIHKILSTRVFGERVINAINVSGGRGQRSRSKLVVTGSDGSTHLGQLALNTARAFQDQDDMVVTFNNSIVFLQEPEITHGRLRYPFHSVPMTRSALDDMSNKGMVLIRGMYSSLEDSEYEHMSKCATDVVQWRVDKTVFCGEAHSIGDGQLLPPPGVHFRDGTVTLQERELQHYNRPIDDPYGQFVREGFILAKGVLERIMTGGERRRVFAGATKTTQIRLFSSLLCWYICRGSARPGAAVRPGRPAGRAIDPNWDQTLASFISDTAAMTALLASITDPKRVNEGEFLVTCVVIRQFHSLLPDLIEPIPSRDGQPNAERWAESFERRIEKSSKQREEFGGPMKYLETVHDVAADPFVWMCGHADYASFFINHTGGEPPPTIPRYEFIECLRDLSAGEAAKRVQYAVGQILTALDLTKFSLDRDHNFLTGRRVVKVTPKVIYTAHEQGKALGMHLERELRSIIVAKIQMLRRMRGLRPTDVEILPVPIQRYIQRQLPPSDDPNASPLER